MSPRSLPLLALSALALAGCGVVEADPHRFERWGEAVAAIPVAAEESARRETPRPAVRVEVLDVDSFWAARDGELSAGLRDAARNAAPVLAAAAVERVVATSTPASAPAAAAVRSAPTPAPTPTPMVARADDTALVQLGAFSSEQAALEAWRRIRTRGGAPLARLQPVLEPVERDGRALVRLKAGPVDPSAAESVCRAAGVADRWCASTGRS